MNQLCILLKYRFVLLNNAAGFKGTEITWKYKVKILAALESGGARLIAYIADGIASRLLYFEDDACIHLACILLEEKPRSFGPRTLAKKSRFRRLWLHELQYHGKFSSWILATDIYAECSLECRPLRPGRPLSSPELTLMDIALWSTATDKLIKFAGDGRRDGRGGERESSVSNERSEKERETYKFLLDVGRVGRRRGDNYGITLTYTRL